MHLDKVRSDYRQKWAAPEDCSAKAKRSLGEHDNFHILFVIMYMQQYNTGRIVVTSEENT